MMDTAQILLIVVIIVLAGLLLLLGIQVYFILREFQKTVAKINKVLDDAGTITESISGPVANLSSVVSGFKTGMSILNLFKKDKREQKEDMDNGE